MNERLWVSAATLVAVVLIAAPAAGQPVYKKGSDIFVTPADGATTIDLSLYPVADMLGGAPSPSLVPLKGKPIAGLGQTDTVVDRLQDVQLAQGETASGIPVVLRGLSLVSINPVTAGNKQWDVFVGVSPSAPSAGSITMTRNHVDGGSFNSSIQVVPYLIFTSGTDEVVIDCAHVCDDTINLTSTRSPWVTSDGNFNPASAGVPNIPNGTVYDGDGDGIADNVFLGGSNVFTGFSPTTYKPVNLGHDHPPVAEHQQGPNIQCKTRTVSTASTLGSETVDTSPTPTPALCVAVADPVEPAEPTEPVVITGG